MSAYLSAQITIKDPTAFRDYAEKARPTIAAHCGEAVAIGKVNAVLVGEAGHHFAALFRFADDETLRRWYNSPEYQAIVPLRDAGADVVFCVLEDM